MRDRIIWMVLAIVLAAFAFSLWQDSVVASLGAGIIALYAAFSAVRGRCFGGVCVVPETSNLTDEEVCKK